MQTNAVNRDWKMQIDKKEQSQSLRHWTGWTKGSRKSMWKHTIPQKSDGNLT